MKLASQEVTNLTSKSFKLAKSRRNTCTTSNPKKQNNSKKRIKRIRSRSLRKIKKKSKPMQKFENPSDYSKLQNTGAVVRGKHKKIKKMKEKYAD